MGSLTQFALLLNSYLFVLQCFRGLGKEKKLEIVIHLKKGVMKIRSPVAIF